MRYHQTNLRPLFRWLAGLTLLVWLGANVLCQTHCLLDSCDSETDDTVSGKLAVAESHSATEHDSQPDHHDNQPNASCETLKSVFNQKSASLSVTPPFTFSYTLVSTMLALDATRIEPAATILRQPPDRKSALAPVVCLGPAFRSQAPPVLL